MKNLFKSRFSLVAICIILGILIGSFALCGCKTNSGLIEGYTEGNTGGTTAPTIPPAPTTPPVTMTGVPSQDTVQQLGNIDIGKSLQEMGANLGTSGNAITQAIGKAMQTLDPTSGIVPKKGKEPFQVSRPLAWGPIKEDENDDVNLTKWVSDAIRYSKGMGNEDHLDSYQYNSGPQIPLPEGQLFFFKDTKFHPSCCPATYASSKGCACMSKKQFQYLTMRGGNNTIPENKTSYFNEF
jgi:hypothetical protein